MNHVCQMPTSGQFVAVWVHNDTIWSRTFRWEGKQLTYYCLAGNKWSLVGVEQPSINDIFTKATTIFIQA